MTRPTVIWTLFTIAMTMNQVTAKNFVKQALKNLERYQAQHKQDRNQRDDSVHAIGLNSYDNFSSVGPALYIENDNLNQKLIQQRDAPSDDSGLQDLRNLVEQALGGDDSGDKKHDQRKKKNNERSKLGQFNVVDLDNVIFQNRVPEKRKQKSLLEMLGASKTRQPASDDFKDSEVFMILDADTLQSGPEDRLDDLVSALLKSSASSHKDRDGPPEYRYKGFRVKVPKRGSYRKARGDSNEKYASDDNDEIARPVKRPRAYVGKGRTAIPYIRNRGDIYEKDY